MNGLVQATDLPVRSARDAARERGGFWSGMAIALAVVVFLGFGPTFYLRAWFAPALHLPPLPSVLVWVHGVVFTSWMVLLLAQVALVRAGQVRLHRRLGAAGAALAALVVAVGFTAQLAQTHRVVATSAFAQDLQARTVENAVTLVALTGILAAGGLMWAGLHFRRRPDIHRRLMLLATLSIAGAAIGRISALLVFLAPVLAPAGAWISPAITAAFAAAFAIHDLRAERRLHPATLSGGGVVLAFVVLNLLPPVTDFYASEAATHLTRWAGALSPL